jgi:hypothetical protein
MSAHTARSISSPKLGPVLGLGVAGSATLVVASLLVGRLAPTAAVTWLLWFHHRPHASAIGLVLQVLGVGILSWAWWLLGPLVRGAADGVSTVLRAACLWAMPLLVVPPMFSNDVWSYVADGMIVARHGSPYVVTPSALSGPIVRAVSARWLQTPAPYGPLPLWWGGVAAGWTSSPWIQMFAFRLLALLGLAMLAMAVPALAHATGRDPGAAAWLVLAAPFTLAHGVVSGHLDLLVAGLSTVAVLAAVRHHPLAAAVLLGLAASVKFPALILCLPVALAGLPADASIRTKLSRTVTVTGGATLVVWVLGVWSDVGVGWIHGLSAPLSSHTPLALTTDLAVLAGHMGAHNLLGAARFGGPIVLVLLAVVLLNRRRSGSPAHVVAIAGILTVAYVALSPVVHPWYFFGALPFLAIGVWKHRFTRAAVAFTLALGLLAPDDLSLHLPLQGLVQALGLLAAAAALVTRQDVLAVLDTGRAHAGPASKATPPGGETPAGTFDS